MYKRQVPGEAVKGVHNHSVKMPLLAVLDKPLEARSVVCLAGDSPVSYTHLSLLVCFFKEVRPCSPMTP